MDRLPVCDICGRPATIIHDHYCPDGQRRLELDEDGLLICSECKARLVSKPAGEDDQDDDELGEKIKALVGKSAGAICRTLNIPYIPPYQSIIDAASAIAYDEDRYMSEWLFVAQWIDGTTLWQSEDRSFEALVSPNGDIQVQARM